MRTKAQIKMTETIAILIIFFVLVVFGFIFYSNYQKSAMLKIKQESLERNAISLSVKTSYLQEIMCEQTSGQEEKVGTCIDLYKLEALQNLVSGQEFNNYYSALFGSSDIYFSNLVTGEVYAVYNSTPANFTKRTRVRTPVLIRDVSVIVGSFTETKDYFGVLYVDSYS